MGGDDALSFAGVCIFTLGEELVKASTVINEDPDSPLLALHHESKQEIVIVVAGFRQISWTQQFYYQRVKKSTGNKIFPIIPIKYLQAQVNGADIPYRRGV
jgi:hypothetical protein